MKSREEKQRDLSALTEQLNEAKSAMVVGFTKVTVNKDQELRNRLREVGAKYQVVKNTIARRAVKETPYQEIEDNFIGMSAIAWTNEDPVVLSKAVSKFIKDNAEMFTFKTGIVEGKVVDIKQVEAIASLPSKEELIAKLLFLLNAPAQRVVTVINAVPRNLAVVIKQIGESRPAQAEQPKTEAKEEASPEATEQSAAPSAETAEAPAAEETAAPAAEQEASEETAPEPAAE